MTMSARFKLLFRRRSAYRTAFLDATGELTDAGELVLADLSRFCRVHSSTLKVSPVTRMTDTHATLMTEGRREVFNRIVQYLNLTESQIYALMERENGSNQ